MWWGPQGAQVAGHRSLRQRQGRSGPGSGRGGAQGEASLRGGAAVTRAGEMGGPLGVGVQHRASILVLCHV